MCLVASEARALLPDGSSGLEGAGGLAGPSTA